MYMAHLFCSNCGSKNIYEGGIKPNFCTSCGHSLNSLSGGRRNKSSAEKFIQPAQEEHESVDVESLSDEDVEIHRRGSKRSFSLSDLAQMGQPIYESRRVDRGSVPQKNADEVLKKFKEGSASKRNVVD